MIQSSPYLPAKKGHYGEGVVAWSPAPLAPQDASPSAMPLLRAASYSSQRSVIQSA